MGEPPKKDYPPGWNDPPVLNYSPTNPPPKSRITNKRIAFPLRASPPQNTGHPPEFAKTPPLPSTTRNPCIEDLYLKASENFKNILGTLDNEDIKEQIWQMLSAWQSGKFSMNIQNLLTDLSVNMVEANQSGVKEIHLRLAMNTDETVVTIKPYLSALTYLINPSNKS